MFTPRRNMSPFDINMAVDAGFQHVATYGDVSVADVTGLVQDAIFSRGPKGVARTGIFLGGREIDIADDMLQAAQQAMTPPFVSRYWPTQAAPSPRPPPLSPPWSGRSATRAASPAAISWSSAAPDRSAPLPPCSAANWAPTCGWPATLRWRRRAR